MSEQTEVKDTTELAEEYDASNVKEFTVAKITQRNKVVMFSRDVTYTDKKTNKEETSKKTYLWIEIDDKVMPTRANKYTIDALSKGFDNTKPAKWLGKNIVATVQEFNNNKYLVWKPQGKIE